MSKKQQEKINQLVELVRKNAAAAQITQDKVFVQAPYSWDQEKVAEIIQQVIRDEAYQDIGGFEGAKSVYLYSKKHMTSNYARLMVRIKEKDLLGLIAETVREDSRVYPRPTDCRLFSEHPFNIKKDELEQILDQLKKSDYQDIQIVEASNGAPYLFSTKFLSHDHAVALTEWIEVIAKEIP